VFWLVGFVLKLCYNNSSQILGATIPIIYFFDHPGHMVQLGDLLCDIDRGADLLECCWRAAPGKPGRIRITNTARHQQAGNTIRARDLPDELVFQPEDP